MQGPAAAVPAFVALCCAVSFCGAGGPLTAAVVMSLPSEARPGGIALWNTVSSVAGYVGPVVFGWLKGATGSNAAGLAVRAPIDPQQPATACAASTAARPCPSAAPVLPLNRTVCVCMCYYIIGHSAFSASRAGG